MSEFRVPISSTRYAFGYVLQNPLTSVSYLITLGFITPYTGNSMFMNEISTPPGTNTVIAYFGENGQLVSFLPVLFIGHIQDTVNPAKYALGVENYSQNYLPFLAVDPNYVERAAPTSVLPSVTPIPLVAGDAIPVNVNNGYFYIKLEESQDGGATVSGTWYSALSNTQPTSFVAGAIFPNIITTGAGYVYRFSTVNAISLEVTDGIWYPTI